MVAADPRDINYAQLMYGLHAAAVAIGLLTAATVAGEFVFGLPSIIAVIMNYARRERVRGTWLATHFSWQLRTFWWAFAWLAAAWLLFGPLTLILIGWPLLKLSYLAVGVWVAVRVARGWLALREDRPMPR
jgi:uncharacterized membrane protein